MYKSFYQITFWNASKSVTNIPIPIPSHNHVPSNFHNDSNEIWEMFVTQNMKWKKHTNAFYGWVLRGIKMFSNSWILYEKILECLLAGFGFLNI